MIETGIICLGFKSLIDEKNGEFIAKNIMSCLQGLILVNTLHTIFNLATL